MTGVPLCDLQAQYRPLQSEIERAVCRVLASGQAILGPEVAALEKEVASYCGAAYGVGCGSGTDAISLALHALGIGAGDEVIIPPFTFFATAGCVVRTGATPVFADICPDTFNIDPEQIERKITPRTKAIMPVHLYGQCADMKPIWEIAAKHGLPVIEDAAQAFGAEYQGKKAGSLGAIACYSFYPTKNLGTYGDAGLSVTSDPEWTERMQVYRLHGMKPKYHHQVVGWMGRIDAIHAAILRVKLPHVDGWLQKRRNAASRYDRLISDAGLDGWITRPVEAKDCFHTYNQYVVRVGEGHRDALVKHFQAEKIGYEIYYPMPLHLQQCLKHLGYGHGDFPVSEAATRCVLALPMFPEITLEQQTRVVESISAFRSQATPMRRAA
ncbi:MAG: DegT/DnrJ/EryC1/StrS family aminotransferase [Gemmataceae bacterium]|nr:DegT/DnrJ/EryC1/StrS family aminotransferase [Gemmataceae bacterium]